MTDIPRKFTGKSGREYTVNLESMSVERYEHYEKIMLALMFRCSPQQVAGEFQKIVQALTQGNDLLSAHHQATEIAMNNIQSAMQIDQNDKHPVLHMCALVCNFDGENTRRYDETTMMDKIADWSELDMDFFFDLARKFVGSLTGYSLMSEGQSNPQDRGGSKLSKAHLGKK